MNHTGITGNCAACHNGVAATGKSPSHVATAAPCETCHRSTASWAGAGYVHAATDTNCFGDTSMKSTWSGVVIT